MMCHEHYTGGKVIYTMQTLFYSRNLQTLNSGLGKAELEGTWLCLYMSNKHTVSDLDQI